MYASGGGNDEEERYGQEAQECRKGDAGCMTRDSWHELWISLEEYVSRDVTLMPAKIILILENHVAALFVPKTKSRILLFIPVIPTDSGVAGHSLPCVATEAGHLPALVPPLHCAALLLACIPQQVNVVSTHVICTNAVSNVRNDRLVVFG